MREILDTIQEVVKKVVPKGAIVGTVISGSYNQSNGTVDVRPLDGGADILDVRLQTDFKYNKGFVCIPSDGSNVVVSYLSENDAFVSMYSDVEQIYLIGDDFGGLVKVVNLVQRLNIVENFINSVVIPFINGHAHTGVQTGGGTSGPSTLTHSGNLELTVRANLENEKVKHGT